MIVYKMIINVPSKAGYNFNVRTLCPTQPRGVRCISLKSAHTLCLCMHSALGALRMNTPNLPDCPKYMECPILQERMADPVVAKDHHTYERTAIESWFDTTCQGNTTSPLTRALISLEVTPNQGGTMHCPRC